MENEGRQCCICGSNISLIHVKDKLLCQECLIIGNEKVTTLWKHPLETVVKEYKESCFRCLSTSDPEDVHQARVAGRKIRAILGFLGVSKKHELLLPIKQMHHLLNKVREADVLREALKAECENNKVNTEMVRLVTKNRKKLQHSLSIAIPAILNDTFYKRMQTFMNKELTAYTVPLVIEKVVREYEENFYSLVEAYHKSVEDKGKIDEGSITALHAIRIQSKLLRYIYHYLNEMPGEDYQDKIEVYKNVQNQIGDINDVQDWIYQLKAYEKKLDATKSEIDQEKKKLKAKLHQLIEKVNLPSNRYKMDCG